MSHSVSLASPDLALTAIELHSVSLASCDLILTHHQWDPGYILTQNTFQ